MNNKEHFNKPAQNLAEVKVGEWAVIKQINCGSGAKRRFMDLGLISGTRVQAVLRSPCGDPTAFFIRGTIIALRADDCKHITVY